jgi:thiol-disulfide isomerase/thioredoxin
MHMTIIPMLLLAATLSSCATSQTNASSNTPTANVALDSDPAQTAASQVDSRRASLITPGTTAPNFTATTIDGKVVNLHELRGKVVVLDFWATWCGPCATEVPKMSQFATKAKAAGLPIEVLAIEWGDHGDRHSNDDSVQKWARSRDVQLDIIRDNHVANIKKAFGVTAIPSIIFIDPKGVVATTKMGMGGRWESYLWEQAQQTMQPTSSGDPDADQSSR